MMFRAEEWGRRAPGTNPCLGIAKNPRRPVARFLDTDELERLGRALDARQVRMARGAVAAIRLLAHGGDGSLDRGHCLAIARRHLL